MLYSCITSYAQTLVKPWRHQEHWRTDVVPFGLPGHTCAGSLCPFPQPGWESSNICRPDKHTRHEILYKEWNTKDALDIIILRIPQIPISPSICGMWRKKSQIHGGPTPQHIGQMTPQDRFRGLMSVLWWVRAILVYTSRRKIYRFNAMRFSYPMRSTNASMLLSTKCLLVCRKPKPCSLNILVKLSRSDGLISK